MARKVEVGEGVFVCAIHRCVVGKRPQRAQGMEHLLRRAFKQPSTAPRKQGVATEKCRLAINLGRSEVNNVVQCVARCGGNAECNTLPGNRLAVFEAFGQFFERSEEHTSELQSRENLVCRLLLEKKKNN